MSFTAVGVLAPVDSGVEGSRAARKFEALAATFRRKRTYARHVTDWIALDEQPVNEFRQRAQSLTIALSHRRSFEPH
jgi:hypothetical protein